MISIAVLKTIILLNFATALAPRTHIKHRDNKNNTEELSCSLLNFVSTAHCALNKDHLICTKGFTSDWVYSARYDIRHLRIHEWPGKCFDIDILQKFFPNLISLDFINCTHIKTFAGHFYAENKIQKLSMHGLISLREIPVGTIRHMSELRVLDLRRNGLRHIKEEFLVNPPHLTEVYLAGNEWDCSNGGFDWLAMKNENSTVRTRLVDYYQLSCHHQLYRGKPLHKVMAIIREARETCPSTCVCTMTHVVSDPAGTIIPLINVDCAGRQFEEPPISIPPTTTTLHLEGNKLTTIRQIVQNPQYQKLMDLYLDNNSILAVKELEGLEWFSTFRVLSLRGNLLKQIPVFAFDKAFQVNNNLMYVFLGHNPWRCDCHFVPRFQNLLLKYKKVILDLPDIRCSKSEDKTISLVQISTLALGNVCRSSEVMMPISTINIVNLILLMSILLIVSRFLYDWHKFKTTGELPWISTIMP